MFSISVLFAIVVLAGCVFYSTIIFIIDQRKAKQHGCQPAHVSKNRLPFGLDQLQKFIAAAADGRFPQELGVMFQNEGHWTFKKSMLGSTFLQTADPKNIQALLAAQFRDFEIPDLRRRTFYPLMGDGIFTANGKYWEHSRSLLRPQFAREQVADIELEEAHVQDLLQQLPTNQFGWTEPINITPMFHRLTIDSATEFLFGISVHSQRQQSEGNQFEWRNLATSFDTSTKVLSDRAQLFEFYWLYNPKILRDSTKEVHRFADFCVRGALQRAKNEKPDSCPTSGPKQRYTFLDELVKVNKDPIELRNHLIHVLTAGRDTTASLLSWTFCLLARHPSVLNKLRGQILNDFGNYEQTDKITFRSLKSCTYLQHVLNEVLRLYPPVPINGRRATKDTTIPQGGGVDGKSPIFVKKNEEVIYCVCAMHRMKELWGPDADEFKPDRWVNRKHGWEFLPFNGGPRICLGQQFALTEAGYVVTRLLQKFDHLQLVNGSVLPKHHLRLTDGPEEYGIYFHETK